MGRRILVGYVSASVCLRARAQTSPQAADLGGTSWELVKFEGSDGKALTPDDRSKYTVTFEADGR